MSFYPYTDDQLQSLVTSAGIADYLDLQIVDLTPEQIAAAFNGLIPPDLIQLSIVKEKTPHFLVNGNKWHKLKFNLLELLANGSTAVGTFGGAYSNHLVALAEVANRLKLECVGVIRGEQGSQLSPTLKDAADLGMRLHFISRAEYKNRYDADFCRLLSETLGLEAIIPEGGNNRLGVLGCYHWAKLIDGVITQSISGNDVLASRQLTGSYDCWLTAVGTGASLAGLSLYGALGRDNPGDVPYELRSQKVIGVAVLKQAEYIKAEVNQWHQQLSTHTFDNWQLFTEGHGGGYGKWNQETVNFIQRFFQATGIQLDQIYTAKLLLALPQMIADGLIKSGEKVLAIHSGGMQGIRSVPELMA